MSDSSPYFFFSYARGDEDSYLKRFFEDLRWRVSQLSGVAEVDAVGFRDSHGINTGDDWNTKIAGALHTSKVLVCIYTAKFFGREYCGKEFAAFLKRNGAFRYERIRDDADGEIKYRIREARNIIPILWVGEGDLALHPDPKKKLPPYAVRTIQYFTQSLPSRVVKEYQANGLRRMYVKRPSVARDDVIKHFATAIVAAQPLPSADRPRSFEELWDAFWVIPEEHQPQDGAAEAVVTEPAAAAPDAVSPGPGHILAIEVNPASAGPAGWAPYAGGPTLARAVRKLPFICRRFGISRTWPSIQGRTISRPRPGPRSKTPPPSWQRRSCSSIPTASTTNSTDRRWCACCSANGVAASSFRPIVPTRRPLASFGITCRA